MNIIATSMSQLKDSTIKGVQWSAIERFTVQGINFLVQIVLARLLCPEDYGIIGMLAIFMQVAQVLIDSGFASALIQKQKCTEEDYSTVFYFSLAISAFLYFCLFISSPLVARFYDMPILAHVTKVISITLILNALPIIHRTKLVKIVDFKTQSKVSLASAVLSGFLGIVLAYKGAGVWALCVQQISNSALQAVLLFYFVKWFPSGNFSKRSFNNLFGFGSKLLLSSLLNSIYRNLYTFVIGKAFSARSLGCYTRAEQFAMFPSSNLANIISRVAYPIFSKIQEDSEQLSSVYRKMIRFSSLIIFPLMFGLIAVSDPFIITILTEKWRGVIILLQILCLDWSLDHITALNLNLLYVKGRSDLALRLEIIKKTIAVIILFASIPFGLECMCWGRVLYSVIATYANTYYTKRLIGLSLWRQLSDIYPYFVNSAIMAFGVYLLQSHISNPILSLLVSLSMGVVIYILLIYTTCNSIFKECIELIKNKIK